MCILWDFYMQYFQESSFIVFVAMSNTWSEFFLFYAIIIDIYLNLHFYRISCLIDQAITAYDFFYYNILFDAYIELGLYV